MLVFVFAQREENNTARGLIWLHLGVLHTLHGCCRCLYCMLVVCDRTVLPYRLSVLQGSSAVRRLSAGHAPCCLQCAAGLQARQVGVWCCCCHCQPDGQQVRAGAYGMSRV